MSDNFFEPLIEPERVLKEMLNYKPKKEITVGDIVLRQDAEEIMGFINESYLEKYKEKYSLDELKKAYELIRENVPSVE